MNTNRKSICNISEYQKGLDSKMGKNELAAALSERALRSMRNKIFSYGPAKEEQATRVLSYLKSRMLRYRITCTEPTGLYSCLTRAELAKTGTCEPDWY